MLGYIREHGEHGDDAVELYWRAHWRSVVALAAHAQQKRLNAPAEPVFGTVLNRGDAMRRRDIITLLGARRSSLFAARASLG
jgi:hypothetical protein